MFEGFNLTPILIPLLALIAGWAIGFFDSNMRTSKKIKQAEDSAQVAIKEAEAKLASMPKRPVAADDPGMMRIKNENGSLTLELDGVRVNTSAITAVQRKRLIEMLNAIRPWLEGKPASIPAPTATPSSQPTAVSIQDRPVPAPVVASPPPAAPTQAPMPASQASPKKKEEPEAAPTSIVGQINVILQKNILNTPLAITGLSLTESISGGVNVHVGTQRYETVDDIPDKEIVATIRAAIAEWEKKYTPGF